MEKAPIRIAVISGSKAETKLTQKGLSEYENFQVVYQGRSVQTHFRELKKAVPDVVLITTGAPNTFDYELNPRFPKIRKKLPDTKILLRTELKQDHPFIRDAIEAGASVIDERLDYPEIAQTIRRISLGEQVVLYVEPRAHDLETHRPRRGKEA